MLKINKGHLQTQNAQLYFISKAVVPWQTWGAFCILTPSSPPLCVGGPNSSWAPLLFVGSDSIYVDLIITCVSVKLSIAWGLRWDDVWTGGIMLQYWAALCWVMYQTHWMTAYHSLHLLYNWFYSHIIIFVSIINMRTRINVRGY